MTRERLDASRFACEFSADRAYRYRWEYALTPIDQSRTIVFVMLNPSTADEREADPTIRRCIGYAGREGCGRLIVVNLYALRSTDPAALRTHPSPASEPAWETRNDDAIVSSASGAALVVAAWGASLPEPDRATWVPKMLLAAGCRPVCLSTTRDGYPRHPLYVGKDVPFVPFTPSP